jgi:hypothetical protein
VDTDGYRGISGEHIMNSVHFLAWLSAVLDDKTLLLLPSVEQRDGVNGRHCSAAPRSDDAANINVHECRAVVR